MKCEVPYIYQINRIFTMNSRYILLILICTLFVAACHEAKNTRSDAATVDTTPINGATLIPDSLTEKGTLQTQTEDSTLGDFNGDGKQEYAWLVEPEMKDAKGTEEGWDCVGECTSFIKFSDRKIPSIKVERCISGHPDNLGDLNNKAGDEIGVSPMWFVGCWNAYHVYTMKDGKWIDAVEPFPTHCIQWEEAIAPIKKDLHKPGNVIIRYSESTDEAIVTRTKSVRVK